MKNPFIPDYETKERKILAYYRQYAKGMITRDELYQILLDNGHLTDTLKEDFQDKLTDEYSHFISEMLKKPKDEIMDRAYEIVCKEGIKDELLSMPIDDKERAIIQERMEAAGIENMSAYLRKMALDGYIIVLELPELRELVSLLRRSSNNLNQLTKRVHETSRVYDKDLEELQHSQEQLWDAAQVIVKKLSEFL